ncbi:MAG: hypothetical protein LBD95_01485 [Clostridiales Family XIII bacterium]|nr:hypothetical protein [Clostridiales Family XIII bacterium]
MINKKADAKLNHVAQCYQAALGKYFHSVDARFLDKRLRFRGLRFLEELRLRYKIENRFFAISYDLMYEARVCAADPLRRPRSACRLIAKLKGGAGITGAEFILRDQGAADAFTAKALSRLNNPLIVDRVASMDLTDVSAAYDSESAVWVFRCRSIIGSTTWNLIPPITQLIKLREAECVRMIELFELAFDALLREDA